MNKPFFLVLLLTLQSISSNAEGAFIELDLGKETDIVFDAPNQYRVVEGDDFTSVMGNFVEDTEALHKKWGEDAPQFSAGDTVFLSKQIDRYFLQIKRHQDGERESIRLSPSVRVIDQKRDKPVIPIEKIQQFLNRPKLITLEEIENAGYIVENPNHTLLVANGDHIYVRNLEEVYDQDEYLIVRLGQAYRSSENNDVLAYEAVYLGNARLEEWDDPATLTITNAVQAIHQGDRLLALEERVFYEDFQPHPPDPYVVEDAKIIAVVEDTSRIGQYQVVVIDRGSDDGIERGHILNVKRSGHTIKDTVDEDKEEVKLPGQHAGTLLVFRVFDVVSYALVMKATFPIKLFDEVVAP